MANWIASRCDNPLDTLIIDVKDEKVTTGTTVSVDVKDVQVCFTLVEQTLGEANFGIGKIYDSCLNCLNSVSTPMVFSACFDGKFNELVIPGSALPFQPIAGKYYNLDLTITGKEINNINDCYSYVNYTATKPDDDFKFNNKPSEYETCEKCAPFKSAKLLWNDSVSSSFANSKNSYIESLGR